MSYPQQTFPDFNALLTYINTYWVTNGNYEITGVKGNNVVNALLSFIRQSPLNYQKAKVWSTLLPVSITQPVNVFIITAPVSVSFSDNIYYEYTFVNTTDTNIPLLSGLSYYDVNLNQITYIPNKQVLSVSKAQNGMWIQTNNFSSLFGSDDQWHELDFIVGQSTMTPGEITLVISGTDIKINSVKVTADGTRLFPNVTDQFSFSIVYNIDNITITFLNDGGSGNQGVQNGQKIIVDYVNGGIPANGFFLINNDDSFLINNNDKFII